MTTQTDLAQSDVVAAAPAANVRPLYWSVRREIWENRSIYIAPLIVTAVVLLSVMAGNYALPKRYRNLPADPAQRHVRVVAPIGIVAAPIMFSTIIIGLFYSIDSLYGERRDRSILFWKSLPVSDLTTVLSKAAIPMVVLPFLGFAISLVAFYFVFLQSTAVLVMRGVSPAPLWQELRFIQEPVVMLYGMIVHALWLAPMYAWLILVSAWARRTPMLWAVLPVIVIRLIEKMMFNGSAFASMLRYRFSGAIPAAFDTRGAPSSHSMPILDRLNQLTPLNFLATPGLWIGLAYAAVFLAGAVHLRRNREPI